MSIFRRGFYCACLLTASVLVNAQTPGAGGSIPLNDLGAFREPGANWTIGAAAMADLNTSAAMKAVPGTGVAVDVLNPKDNKHLITKQEFGDLELELDFMMAKGSNSGVFLQGRYEVQLLD